MTKQFGQEEFSAALVDTHSVMLTGLFPGLEYRYQVRISDADAARLVAADVFPFHLFAPGEHFTAWYQLLPERSDHFTLRIYGCFPRETLDDPRHHEAVDGVHAVLRMVHQQDIGACEATWNGLGARSFASGRLGPLEKPIWQFNQWWIERMRPRESARS